MRSRSLPLLALGAATVAAFGLQPLAAASMSTQVPAATVVSTDSFPPQTAVVVPNPNETQPGFAQIAAQLSRSTSESASRLTSALRTVQGLATNPDQPPLTVVSATTTALADMNSSAADILGGLRGQLVTSLTQAKTLASSSQTTLMKAALRSLFVPTQTAISIIQGLSVNATSCAHPGVTKPDGSPWTCSFDDEFDGTSLDTTKWLAQKNFVSGDAGAYACYSPNNVSVSGGNLNLVVRKESTPIACADQKYGASSLYSAGSVVTYGLFSQKYGRFEARVKTQASLVKGLQETFWLVPDTLHPDPTNPTNDLPWPARGEIDVAETYSSYPNLAIPFLHHAGPVVQGSDTANNCNALRGVYNTYTMTWAADRIEIDINGVPCLVNTSGDPAFQKPYILAMTSLLGTSQNGNGMVAGTPLPATTSVDYIRAWD